MLAQFQTEIIQFGTILSLTKLNCVIDIPAVIFQIQTAVEWKNKADVL